MGRTTAPYRIEITESVPVKLHPLTHFQHDRKDLITNLIDMRKELEIN